MPTESENILDAIYHIILQRKQLGEDKTSYVKSLYDRGLDKILSKIGEEATEVAVAGKGGERAEVINEVSDLIFHVLVLLGYYDIAPDQIYAELHRRFGVSGIEEKAGRSR